MKHLITLLVTLIVSVTGYAEVVREGNTFKIEKTASVNRDQQTPYTWQDKEGKTYPIFITKNGACYIIKVSKKTGKEYKQYLPKKIKEQINKELQKTNE